MAGAKPAAAPSANPSAGLRQWLTRARWRRRGNWLWPAFVGAIVLDAVIGHALPPQGQSQTLVAAALLAVVLNLLGVILLCRPLAGLIRRRRPDLPMVIARDYAGRAVILSIALVLTLVGLVHHSSIVSQDTAMRDAVARAQAFIGDRAPDPFRRHLDALSTFEIQSGRIYRVCAASAGGSHDYCVIVKTNLPFERSVSFAGHEPNSIFAAGTN